MPSKSNSENDFIKVFDVRDFARIMQNLLNKAEGQLLIIERKLIQDSGQRTDH